LDAGVGVAEGVGVGLAVGDGVGVGDVKAFASNSEGFVESGAKGREVVALELKAIHRPSLLITGRVFVISTLILVKIGGMAVLKSRLFVSVIW
jgi:hypothetical protein